MSDDGEGRKPLTTDDLYGGSEVASPVAGEPESPPSSYVPQAAGPPRDSAGNLVYEETPILEPVQTPAPPEKQNGPENGFPRTNLPDPLATPELAERHVREIPEHTGKPPAKFRGILLFLAIFVLGIAASVMYRNVINSFQREPANETGNGTPAPTPITDVPVTPPVSGESVSTASAEWASYQVWQGQVKTPSGVRYSLPPEMREPVCDGTGCVSAGSYMPGGTRFTVAYYKKNILTPMFSRTVVTDAAGRNFDTREASVSGKPALSFSGSFSGSTTGGYRFTRMSGVMIAAGPESTIEVNHFSPSGVNADFDRDEELFTGILRTFSFE